MQSEKSIKIQRTESLLKELLPEALGTLDDEMLHGLCIVDVNCSKGKYDASVSLDEMMFDEEEKKYILSRLHKVNSHLQHYCMQSEGWFRCPKFRFKFDQRLKEQNRLDEVFEQVDKELQKGKKDDS